MIILESPAPYFSPVEMDANFDAPQHREKEDWELTLSKMKKAILKEDISEARILMYGLEMEFFKAKIIAYNEGFKQGALPLPF